MVCSTVLLCWWSTFAPLCSAGVAMVEMEEGGRGGSKVRKPLEGKPLTHWQETSMVKMAAAGFTTRTTLPHEQPHAAEFKLQQQRCVLAKPSDPLTLSDTQLARGKG